MSKKEKRLIINCGSSHISASVVSKQGENFKIEKFYTEQLDYNFNNENGWLDAISDGIRRIIRRGKLKGKAHFIIPGNQVLTKTLYLPTIEKSKRFVRYAFEAQQNLPFRLDEVVWDSQVLSDDGVETKVLLGACKIDTINTFCRIIRKTGLQIESINASSILTYAALEYSKPEIKGDTLLINVGARSSTLLFKNEEGFTTRTINIGGNSLTQIISDNLGKDFQESDEIKNRFFVEEKSIDEESSAYKLMKTSVSSFSRRFSQEIQRSILMYERQQLGDSIKQIFITGKGSSSSLIRNNLSEVMDSPIDSFDALSGVELAPNLDLDRDTLNFELSEVVGEALKEFRLVKNYGNLNLLPLGIQQEIIFNRKKPLLVLLSLLIGASPWLFYMGIQESIDLAESSNKELVRMSNPFEDNKSLINENRQKAEELSESISKIEGLRDTKTNWIQFFADLQDSIYNAKDVWIDDIVVQRPEVYDDVLLDDYQNEYDDWDYELDDLESNELLNEDYKVLVKGTMLVREPSREDGVLSNRIKNLQASFENSSFVTGTEDLVIFWEYQNEGLRILPFEINLIINPNKPL